MKMVNYRLSPSFLIDFFQNGRNQSVQTVFKAQNRNLTLFTCLTTESLLSRVLGTKSTPVLLIFSHEVSVSDDFETKNKLIWHGFCTQFLAGSVLSHVNRLRFLYSAGGLTRLS